MACIVVYVNNALTVTSSRCRLTHDLVSGVRAGLSCSGEWPTELPVHSLGACQPGYT